MSNSRIVRVVFILSMTIASGIAGARASSAADEKSPPGPQKEKDKESGKTAARQPKAPTRSDKSDKSVAAEVTLKGDLTCARCSLHEGTVCQNVLRVKEAAGAEAKYYLAKNAVAEENHGKICGGSAPATVTGKVSSEGGKKIITPSSVTFD